MHRHGRMLEWKRAWRMTEQEWLGADDWAQWGLWARACGKDHCPIHLGISHETWHVPLV